MPDCKCCGVPMGDVQRGVCIMCAHCDGLHGDELEQRVRVLVANGKTSMWRAIVRMALDDAQLTGAVTFKPSPTREGMCDAWIARAPRRWEVVAARALVRKQQADLETVIGACMAPYLGGRATTATLQALADELTTALHFLDPNVIDVEVMSKMDALDPGHLVININHKTAVGPGVVHNAAPGVPLPDDIMLRPRGQA